MSRLDEAISDVAYILDALRCYRSIEESGSCNDCKQDCEYAPKPGEQVRYNCPFFKRQQEVCRQQKQLQNSNVLKKQNSPTKMSGTSGEDLIRRQDALDILDDFAGQTLELVRGAYERARERMCKL